MKYNYIRCLYFLSWVFMFIGGIGYLYYSYSFIAQSITTSTFSLDLLYGGLLTLGVIFNILSFTLPIKR